MALSIIASLVGLLCVVLFVVAWEMWHPEEAEPGEPTRPRVYREVSSEDLDSMD